MHSLNSKISIIVGVIAFAIGQYLPVTHMHPETMLAIILALTVLLHGQLSIAIEIVVAFCMFASMGTIISFIKMIAAML